MATQIVAERDDLEEKLYRMRTHANSRVLLHMFLDDDFRTLCQVAEYNRRHPENPIQQAPEPSTGE